MADVIRDVVIRIGLEQKSVALKVPGIETATKQVNDYEKAQKAAETAQKKAATEAERSAAQLAAAHQKLATVVTAGGEGAFALARGLAILSASGEQDLRVLIDRLAAVHAGFDILKGSVITIQQVTNAIQALRTASDLAALGGVGKLIASLTPAGRVIAAVGAAASLAASAVYVFGNRTAEAANSTQDLVSELTRANEAYQRRNELEQQYQQDISRTTQLEQRRIDALRAIGAAVPSASRERQQLELRRQQLEGVRALPTGQDKSLFESVLGVARDRPEQTRVAYAQELERITARIEALDRQRLDSARTTQQLARDQVRSYTEIVSKAAEQVRIERNRVLGVQETIGRLTALERGELGRLSEQAKKGTITREGVLRAEELAGGVGNVQQFAQKFFQQQGANQLGLVAGFGGKPLTGQGSALAAATSQFQQALQESGGFTKAVTDLLGGLKDELTARRDLIQSVTLLSQATKQAQELEAKLRKQLDADVQAVKRAQQEAQNNADR